MGQCKVFDLQVKFILKQIEIQPHITASGHENMICEMLTFCTSKKQVTYFDHVLILILTDKMRAFQAAICKHFHENGILKREFSFITYKSKPNCTLPSFFSI